MMKKGLFFTILVLLAVSSFAQDIRNRYLYIDGSASKMEHVDFFKRSLTMEATGCGYVITSTMGEALHTLRFRVVSETLYDPDYDMDFEQNTITMTLQRNEDSATLVTFDYSFASIDETYTYMRTLFLNSVTPIPIPFLTEEGTQWDKWVYFRASFDYPVTFYFLQPTGLVGTPAIGVYYTDPDKGERTRVSPLDHKIMAMPGATLGVEYQRFNFLSFELNFQLSMGDTRDNYYVNTAAGLDLKVPIKFKNVMLVPYGEFLYTFHISPIFSEFPPFAAGGGVQFCVRGGKNGAFFVDAKYMFSFGDAVMHNLYELTPEPAVIHYKRSHLGIGIGYKIGVADRPK
jgi:hypothetical protein